jgi:hypothetical protein
MKSRPQRMFVFLLLSATGAAAPAQQDTTGSAIIGRALAPSPLAQDLQRLTDEAGGRVSGTPAMARAVDSALSAFHAAGIEADLLHVGNGTEADFARAGQRGRTP